MLCLAALVVITGGAIWMIVLLRGSDVPHRKFFEGWKNVFEAWRDARDLGEKTVIILLILRQGLRRGLWAVLLAYFAMATAVVGSLCGFQLPELIRAISDFVERLPRLIRELRYGPEIQASCSSLSCVRSRFASDPFLNDSSW